MYLESSFQVIRELNGESLFESLELGRNHSDLLCLSVAIEQLQDVEDGWQLARNRAIVATLDPCSWNDEDERDIFKFEKF